MAEGRHYSATVRGAILALTVAMGACAPAFGQTFDVKQLDVAKGSFDINFDSTVQRGLPPGGGFDRSSHELGANYGLTDWWRISALLNISNPPDAGVRIATAALENIFVLKPISEKADRDAGLGWFAYVEVATEQTSTNAAIFGPILGAKIDRLSLTANPFLKQTFGRNHIDGIAFTYAWQAKLEVTKTISIGVEGFGAIDNIGNAPRLSEQEHRIGPVLFTEWNLGNGVTLNPDFGVFFGLTNGSPDLAVKVNVGIPLIKPAKSE